MDQATPPSIDPREVEFVPVYGTDRPDVVDAVKALWANGGHISDPQEREKRSSQIVSVAMHGQRVLGVTTAYKLKLPDYNPWMYYWRILVTPDARVAGLSHRLILSMRDTLEAKHQEDGDPICAGMITEVQNQAMQANHRLAVWPGLNMVYAGVSPNGNQLRVYYFRRAKV